MLKLALKNHLDLESKLCVEVSPSVLGRATGGINSTLCLIKYSLLLLDTTANTTLAWPDIDIKIKVSGSDKFNPLVFTIMKLLLTIHGKKIILISFSEALAFAETPSTNVSLA